MTEEKPDVEPAEEPEEEPSHPQVIPDDDNENGDKDDTEKDVVA